MKTIHTFAALSLLLISACQSTESEDSAVQGRVFPPDEEVLAKVYSNFYQVPDYFYVDERTDTPQSYSLYHVKDVSNSYELCTDDYQEALDWEASDNDSRAVTGVFVDLYENDRYFEIIRELAYPDGIGNITDSTSPGFARVFKCAYVNRDGVDRNVLDGYAGNLNGQSLFGEVIRTYTEYMWQFTFFWPAKKKVLETFSTETEGTYQHTLLLAFATNQGADKCDLIEIVDWVFSVNKDSGEITKDFDLLYQMEAQLVNGIPQKCDM